MKTLRTLLIITPAILALTSGARADIVETSGEVEKIATPADLRTGQVEDNSKIVIFPEQIGVKATGPIKVDISKPGNSPKTVLQRDPKDPPKRARVNPNLSRSVISRGKSINSYFIHFDPVGSGETHHKASGSVTFDEEVLGLIVTSEKLNATHSFPGLAGTSYPHGDTQEVEFDREGTSVALSPDRRTVTITLVASTSSANIRIITDASIASTSEQGGSDKTDRKPKKGGAQGGKPMPQGAGVLKVPSKWSGTRTSNQFPMANCTIVVAERNGDILSIDYCEHHCQIKLRMYFKLQGHELIFQDFKNQSIGDWTIENMTAQGSTDGEGMQIGYSWLQSGGGRRRVQNASVSGSIDVTRD